MPHTVFYAWQSDRANATNHYLIRDAAKDAIKKLSADLRVEEAERFDLDHDTKNVPGMPNVAMTITQKITDCGVFLADLTTVAGYTTEDNARHKKSPNPNVMFELGCALTSGTENVIVVINTYYGSHDDLPFDLKNFRKPIEYSLAPDADKPTRIANQARLAEDLVGALRLMQENGIWTRRSELLERERAEQRASQRKEAGDVRQKFEIAVADNRFHSFKADFCVAAVSIVPNFSVNPFVELNNENQELVRRYMQPFGLSYGANVQIHPRSFICLDQYGPVPHSLVELTEEGVVFAVTNYGRNRDQYFQEDVSHRWDKRGKPFTFNPFKWQNQIVDILKRCLSGLRQMNMAGEYYVGVSLLKMGNTRISFGEHWEFVTDGQPGRTNKEEAIVSDSVLVAPDADISSPEMTRKLLHRPLAQLWRHFGFAGVPRLTANNWIEWEP